jgi:hypothetical protein
MMTAEGRLLIDDTGKDILNWILTKMVIGIAGGKWKPKVSGGKIKQQRSMMGNITPSDLSFALYLLKHYRRENVGDRKKRFKDKEFLETFMEYCTWVMNYSTIMKKKLAGKDRDSIDEWVEAVMARGDGGKKGSHGSSDDVDEEGSENERNLAILFSLPSDSSLKIPNEEGAEI